MKITPTGVAIAFAVVVALGLLFYGPMFLTSPGSLAENLLMTEPTAEDREDGTSPVTELPGGLVVSDLVEGAGATAEVGDTLTVHYVGQLQDGTVFDSSQGRAPFSFTIGQGSVIAGWEQGLLGMKEGGRRILMIPPSLAYGEQDLGVIPPNSTLIFQVELLTVVKP